MTIRIATLFGICSALAFAGCGDDATTTTDMGVTTDMGGGDAGVTDSGTTDSGSDDGAVADMNVHVPDWACLGSVTFPAATTETVPFSAEVLDFLGNAPIEGVAGTVCPDRTDVNCEGGVTTDPSDTDGLMMTTLQTGMGSGGNGFFGYFRLEKEGYLNLRAFTYRPLAAELTDTPRAWMFTPTAANTAAVLAGATIDDTKGIVIVRFRDCTNTDSSGASFSDDITGATRFYARGNVISSTATETDFTGVGGFINVEPGAQRITATNGTDTIGYADILVEANTVTLLFLGPTPAAPSR